MGVIVLFMWAERSLDEKLNHACTYSFYLEALAMICEQNDWLSCYKRLLFISASSTHICINEQLSGQGIEEWRTTTFPS